MTVRVSVGGEEVVPSSVFFGTEVLCFLSKCACLFHHLVDLPAKHSSLFLALKRKMALFNVKISKCSKSGWYSFSAGITLALVKEGCASGINPVL